MHLSALLLAFTVATAAADGDYWLKQGLQHLQERLARREITDVAKNVILFLGDGMSVSTVTAARIYQGQMQGMPGEESSLSFERFPWTGLSKTYCVDAQVPDSACTSSAYLSGVKANIGTIGVSSAVKLGDCAAALNTSNHVTSILQWAQQASKATGIVTTTRVTHASPAGAYAHSASRDWESDADLNASKKITEGCSDIAKQLVTTLPGKDINIIFGGGRSNFFPSDSLDEEKHHGRRKDGQHLIKEWVADKESRGVSHEYVWDRSGMLALDTNSTDYILGLFSSSHMPFASDDDSARSPSLKMMVRKALDVLRRNPNGYFLFVEGGKIDLAHHDLQARRALQETVAFSQAVEETVRLVSEEDTLVVVTADHSHTMTMGGYPARGSDILGVAGRSGVDKLPFMTLSYSNGPVNHQRHDLLKDDIKRNDYQFPSFVPMRMETHSGEDVAVYARGPWAHLLSGVMEQNVIPAVMGYAACLRPQEDSQRCPRPQAGAETTHSAPLTPKTEELN